jgi:hypothetical protein
MLTRGIEIQGQLTHRSTSAAAIPRREKQKRLRSQSGSHLAFKRLLMIQVSVLEQTERHFNWHLRRDSLSARTDRRPELPLPHGFNRFFVQT